MLYKEYELRRNPRNTIPIDALSSKVIRDNLPKFLFASYGKEIAIYYLDKFIGAIYQLPDKYYFFEFDIRIIKHNVNCQWIVDGDDGIVEFFNSLLEDVIMEEFFLMHDHLKDNSPVW